ncbi:MAG: TonB-dependent receptor plug domain-containing protein [Bacteroidota bacterium]|nr:TonB-dependent receptor plug domain-containing protein [Bacteroidota bacterium]
MKTRIFFMLLTVTSLMLSINLRAQERMVRGVVTTFDSIPLIGASVIAQNTKQEVLTDSLGNFSIRCKNNDKLKVSAHGFYNQDVKLTGKIKFAAINLKLKPGEKEREFAIGYGHVADTDRLNSVTDINKNDFDFSNYHNILDLIKARCPGVYVYDNAYIVSRGINSINTRDNSTLVLVNGIPYTVPNLKSIAPSQVKSIDYIKDAGAAIYGARGANGVILIELKK